MHVLLTEGLLGNKYLTVKVFSLNKIHLYFDVSMKENVVHDAKAYKTKMGLFYFK